MNIAVVIFVFFYFQSGEPLQSISVKEIGMAQIVDGMDGESNDDIQARIRGAAALLDDIKMMVSVPVHRRYSSFFYRNRNRICSWVVGPTLTFAIILSATRFS